MLRCRTADFVEPDMDWEAEHYRQAGVDFKAYALSTADVKTLAAYVGDAHVLIVDQTPVGAELIARLTDARLIIRHGDGYDSVDVDAATAAGIAVANKPGFWSMEAAEHAMVLTMVVAAHLPLQQQVAARIGRAPEEPWRRSLLYPIPRLRGRTVGIFGFGKIGRHYARFMHTLGCPVIVYDHRKQPEAIRAEGYYPVDFDTFLRESDILSIHTPATEQTRGRFNRETIGKMKQDAVLINTARGSIVDTDALTEALQTGRLRGAGLDVTDPEPLPQDHPLLRMPQVVVTPHLAWYSEEAMWAMRESIVEDVINLAQGIMPTSVVNPEVLPETPGHSSRSLVPDHQ